MDPRAEQRVRADVQRAVESAPITDVHTHLYDPALGPLLLSGIDELVTYHYLVAEVLRARPDVAPADFYALSKTAQADLVWSELFVRRAPVSEACRGVLTVLSSLGLDPAARDLRAARAYFARRTVAQRVTTAFELAGVERAYMTNDPLDLQEGSRWSKGFRRDPRFLGVLRLDSAIMNWPRPVAALRAVGYSVERALSPATFREIRRYLSDWSQILDARYMAVSLPPTFSYPSARAPETTLLVRAVLPVARELGLPVALMVGVKKLVRPELELAGDSVGRSDVGTLERLALDFPDVRFLVTLLSRENQHELCVAARKFANLLVFGCWWFLNNPSLIREMTAMRLELLGLSFTPQHSDARVLEQLIYKWRHSRTLIADVLAEKYVDLLRAGRPTTAKEIERDVRLLFGGPNLARSA